MFVAVRLDVTLVHNSQQILGQLISDATLFSASTCEVDTKINLL